MILLRIQSLIIVIVGIADNYKAIMIQYNKSFKQVTIE
jgi:hypothetical protein